MRRPASITALLLSSAVLVGSSAAAAAGSAQEVPVEHPAVREALDYLAASEERAVADQVALCEIPAPPFGEERRGADTRRRFETLGLDRVRVDGEGNVLGERPGAEEGPVVVLSAHLDTVFPPGTDVTVRREGDTLVGPGIGDDCRGLAVVLAVARALHEVELDTVGTIVFVGTVGEEGPGDLRGVKHLFRDELAGEVDFFISVDGAGLGITHAAVGSNRYEVTYTGPGGHSFHAFGMPNPIHALGRAIARIGDLEVPASPKTTFNVGLVEGGTSVNSIAYATTMTVDLRSESAEVLAGLDREFRAAVREALDEENARWDSDVVLDVEIESIGVRPAAAQSEDAPIVRTAVAAARALGFEPELAAASTDANFPMSLGIPAITIDGGGSGAGAHSLEETFSAKDSDLGTRWALLLTLALAGVR